MLLHDQLRAGLLGVRVQLGTKGTTLEIVDQGPRHLRWHDPEFGAVGMAAHSPFPLDLSDARRPTLRAELEAEARAIFERAHATNAKERAALEQADPERAKAEAALVDRPPRTADPSWSPIVECELVEREPGRVLRTLSRITYEPGHELIRGQLALPLTQGHLRLSLIHRAGLTGFRESALSIPLLEAAEDPTAMEHPGQAFYDDPRHDAQFPQHGLSCVRQGLSAWLDPDDGLQVLDAPPLQATGTRVELPTAASSIVPPPGFLFVPREVLPMAPTLASLVRVGLEPAPDSMIDVWRLEQRFRGPGELRQFADQTLHGWSEEGAEEVQVHSEVASDGPHAVAVRSQVSMRTQSEPRHTLVYWFVDDDGESFRVSLGFSGAIAFEDQRPTFDALVSSWRRLAVEPTPEPEPERSWWRRLFSK